jgi:hypothetical protein
MVEERFLSYPLGDVLDLQCWLATMETPVLDATGVRVGGSTTGLSMDVFDILFKQLNISMKCNDCNSEGFKQLPATLDSKEGNAEVTDMVRNLMHKFLSSDGTGNNIMQAEVDRMLAEAPKRCRHSPSYRASYASATYETLDLSEATSSSMSFLSAMLSIVLVLLALFGISVLTIRMLATRRNQEYLRSLPPDQLLLVCAEQKKLEEEETIVNNMSTSMFNSVEVPVIVKWLIPIVLLGNAGLFLSGHLSKGGSVQLYIDIDGQRIIVDNFYSFSIAQSALELWDAGGKFLAVCISCCDCALLLVTRIELTDVK